MVDRDEELKAKEARRRRRQELWRNKVEDPLFRRDVVQIGAAFATADAETAGAWTDSVGL